MFEPEGIPADLIDTMLEPVNSRLASFVKVLGWATVEIESDMNITCGGRSLGLLSESEVWRVDAMITATIAVFNRPRLGQ